jgi:hypothetical protein
MIQFHRVHGTSPFGYRDDNIVYCLRLQRRPVQGERVGDEGAYKGDTPVLPRFLPGLHCEFEREPANGRARHAHHLILDAIAEMLH